MPRSASNAVRRIGGALVPFDLTVSFSRRQHFSEDDYTLGRGITPPRACDRRPMTTRPVSLHEGRGRGMFSDPTRRSRAQCRVDH